MMIVPMNESHVAQVAELEKICFSDPWSEKSVASELSNPLSCWLVAEEDGLVAGYVGSQTVIDESDMMNVAVHPDHRRKGIAEKLVVELVEALKKRGITVITHVILGLPGESRAQMLETVRYVGQHTDGIKLQLLHVLRGTDLAEDYELGKFQTLELEEYCRLIADCLRHLPKEVVIHRLTGDGAKKDLIAPLWSGNKKNVLNTLNRILSEEDVQQGELTNPSESAIL